jgi:hypothetical protein
MALDAGGAGSELVAKFTCAVCLNVLARRLRWRAVLAVARARRRHAALTR